MKLNFLQNVCILSFRYIKVNNRRMVRVEEEEVLCNVFGWSMSTSKLAPFASCRHEKKKLLLTKKPQGEAHLMEEVESFNYS